MLIPSRPKPDLETSVRDVVDGRRDLREQRRMPMDVPADEDADADPLGVRRLRRERRPGVEDRTGRVAARGGLREMVRVPDLIEARLVSRPPDLTLLGDRVVRLVVESDLDRRCQCAWAAPFSTSSEMTS